MVVLPLDFLLECLPVGKLKAILIQGIPCPGLTGTYCLFGALKDAQVVRFPGRESHLRPPRSEWWWLIVLLHAQRFTNQSEDKTHSFSLPPASVSWP